MEEISNGLMASWNDFQTTPRPSIHISRIKAHITELQSMDSDYMSLFMVKVVHSFSNCENFNDLYERKISDYITSRLGDQTTDHQADKTFIHEIFGIFGLAGRDVAFDLTNLSASWNKCGEICAHPDKLSEINANIKFVCTALYSLEFVWEFIHLIMERYEKHFRRSFSLEEHVNGRVQNDCVLLTTLRRTNPDHLDEIKFFASEFVGKPESTHDFTDDLTISSSSDDRVYSSNLTSLAGESDDSDDSTSDYEPRKKKRRVECQPDKKTPLWPLGKKQNIKRIDSSKIIMETKKKPIPNKWTVKSQTQCMFHDCKEQAVKKQCSQCNKINGWALSAKYCECHKDHDFHVGYLCKCELLDLVHRSKGFRNHFITDASDESMITFCAQMLTLGVATETFWGQDICSQDREVLFDELCSTVDEMVCE